ncbi:uncharacterized protein LOC143298670 [Babylonia areolata]|uniref:uncharacterized protein LOC143298670 n=1 Tax=Babylonia areolata TaxID=304850 RepID=UPI003FD14DD5
MSCRSRCFLALLSLLSLLPPLSGAEAQEEQQQESLLLVDGDVVLGAMLSVGNIQGQDGCAEDYDEDTLKEMMAARWFLVALNDMGYIPGVRLGLDVYRTCQSGQNHHTSAR